MRGKDIIGFINIIIVLAILGGLSYLAVRLQPEDYDPRTLCLTAYTPPHLAFVIDKTDLYSQDQAETIESLVLESRYNLRIGEKLSLYELDARGSLVNSNEFELCNPGRGDQINPLYRNPQRIEAHYQSSFEGPLQTALADLVEPKESPSSPIIEALARLSVRNGFDTMTPARRVVLVSDMLQNSDLFSFYGRNRSALIDTLPEYRDIARQIEQGYGDGLAGVTIEVHLIPRKGWETQQNGIIKDYWSDIFRELGVRLVWTGL